MDWDGVSYYSYLAIHYFNGNILIVFGSKLGFIRIGFTLPVLKVFTCSSITPPKSEPIWMKSGALLSSLSGLILADFGRDLESGEL